VNYAGLGQLLAATGGLDRDEATGHGLLWVRPDGKTLRISKGRQLAPLIVDRVPFTPNRCRNASQLNPCF
jgi:hypothetical protein